MPEPTSAAETSTHLEIVFEGPGVQAGTINASILADALVGCSDVFARANQIINGVMSEAVVLVQSDFKHGSFVVDIQVLQNVVEYAKHLLTPYPFISATGLAAVVGFVSRNKEVIDSLIDVFKWLRGKKPDKVSSVGNDSVELRLGKRRKQSRHKYSIFTETPQSGRDWRNSPTLFASRTLTVSP